MLFPGCGAVGVLLAQEDVQFFPLCEVVKGWLAVGSAGAECRPWALGAFPVCAAALWEMALATALLRAAAAAGIVQAAPGMSGNEELPDWFGASPSLPSLTAPPVTWYVFLSHHMTK